MKEGSNELYMAMNLYYLGHYQQCINEASKIRVRSFCSERFLAH